MFLSIQKVIRLLVERYILDKTSGGGDADVGVTRADIMGIRNDVAVFRYVNLACITYVNLYLAS